MHRLSKLKSDKEALEILIEETKLKYPADEPITESHLKKIFKEHKKSLAQRYIQLIKKFIAIYVEKVLVHSSHGELYHK
ncbi:hypothetical protein FC777_12760 [Clostridium botulinum]|nr:hypothetical protein [Clostridium botulinum]